MLLAPRILLLRRYARRHAGYFGARCPMCFGLTHHRMQKFGTRIWLLTVIPLPGRYLFHESRCAECGVYRAYDLAAGVTLRSETDPDILVFTAETNPGDLVLDRAGVPYTLDEILSESLDADRRLDAIYQYLDGMRYEAERAQRLAVPSPPGVIVSFVGSFTLLANVLLLLALVALLPGNSARPTGLAAAVVGVGGLVSMGLAAVTVLMIPLSLWLWLTRREWAIRKRVMPRLVAALVPLYPTEAELAHLFEELRKEDLAIGNIVKAKKLARAVEHARLKAGWEVVERAGV